MKPAPLILAATLLCNATLIGNALIKHHTAEAEYIALYDAQAAVNDQTAGANLPASELKRLREAAAQTVLTPERFAEYKIATTESYEDVRNLVTWSKLPFSSTP